MLTAYRKFWLGYVTFTGRTKRRDFWLAGLAQLIINLILLGVSGSLYKASSTVLPDLWMAFSWLFAASWLLFCLLSFLPTLAIMVRRLRDANLPWPLLFLWLTVIGGLALLVMFVLPSSAKTTSIQEFYRPTLKAPKINEVNQKVSFLKAVTDFFRGYVDFRGRSSRAGYWWLQLSYFLVNFILFILTLIVRAFDVSIFGSPSVGSYLMTLIFVGFWLATLLPQLALQVRRLRDIGLSNFSIIGLLSLITICLLFWETLQVANYQSYGMQDFQLANHLLFLVLFVCAMSLILLSIMSTDELVRSKKSLLYRTKPEISESA